MGFLNLLKFTKAKCNFKTQMDNFSFNWRNFSSEIKHTIAYLQECYAMALQHASSSTRETHHKPTTRKRWINALVFQKTLLPLLRFEKNTLLSSQKTWWRKRGENPQKTQGATRPYYPKNPEKWWRKPKNQHSLVIQKTEQNDGENHLKNIHSICRCTQTTSRRSS